MVYMVSRDLPIFVSAVNKGFGAKRIGRKHMRQAGTSAHLTKVADASRLDPVGSYPGTIQRLKQLGFPCHEGEECQK
jgi:hypothetical protein